MPAKCRVSSEDLCLLYAEHRSIYAVASIVGIRPSSVHERLVKLGVAKPMNVFSEAEKDRLRSEYCIAADAGKLDSLAADMGRTKPFICRQAKELGLTDRRRQKVYLATWKYVAEEYAEAIFDAFKASRLNVRQYCAEKGYDKLGFTNAMKRFFPDQWEHVVEIKAGKQTMYRLGRSLEYRVRDALKSGGYFVTRSPASRSPVDLTAIKTGLVLLVQCKRGGTLNVGEWNEIYDLAISVGALPIMASSPTGRGTVYHKLIGRKDDTKKRQPMEPFDPFAANDAVATIKVAA